MFAVLSIPNFSLQAVLRHQPELRGKPVALVDEDAAKSVVGQVTEAAGAFGVAPGITSTQAKARCEQIAFRIRSPQQEESAQEILLGCAYACAAYIESTGPGICTLDLRGLPLLKAENLAAGLEAWGRQLIQSLEEFHLAARLGIASAPALARQAASGDLPVKYIRDPQEFWSTLPIEKLSSSPELVNILHKWGISTVAVFLALGKEKIAERLGPEGLALFENAQADKVRPLKLTIPKQSYVEYFEFEYKVETLEPLLFIVRRLLDQLTRRVAAVHKVIQDLIITLHLESSEPHERTLKIPAPTLDGEILFRILHNYLETVRTSSAIIAVSLRAEPCPAKAEQFQLFEHSVRNPNRFYETIGRLAAMLGPDRVGTPQVHDTFRPDDFSIAPVTLEKREGRGESSQGDARRGLLLRRFRPPLPAAVTLQDGQPVSVRNGRFNSAIQRSQGPYRASGQWWEDLWTREEWDIETNDGALYRVFHSDGHWFVEGAYD